MAPTHFVETPCRCDDAEDCTMARYISDVRIAEAKIERLQYERTVMSHLLFASDVLNARLAAYLY